MKIFGVILVLLGLYFLWPVLTLATGFGLLLVGGGSMALGAGRPIKALMGRKVKELNGGYD